MRISRPLPVETLAGAREAERLYREAARQHLAGDVERAKVTRLLARDAMVRASSSLIPDVAIAFAKPGSVPVGRAMQRDKAAEVDRQAWEAALRAERPA